MPCSSAVSSGVWEYPNPMRPIYPSSNNKYGGQENIHESHSEVTTVRLMSWLHIDAESSQPLWGWGRINIQTPGIVVLNSDTPPTLRFSYYILGELDAC